MRCFLEQVRRLKIIPVSVYHPVVTIAEMITTFDDAVKIGHEVLVKILRGSNYCETLVLWWTSVQFHETLFGDSLGKEMKAALDDADENNHEGYRNNVRVKLLIKPCLVS